MQSFFEWHKHNTTGLESWLVMGKGPTFDKHKDYDLANFKLMSLNHAVENLTVAVAHIIDIDVIEDCADAIYSNAQILVMPWVPHVNSKPGVNDLSQLVQSCEFLLRMNTEGRLVYYNHLEKRKRGNSPMVEVRYFSSEAAINLLAMAGVKTIRTLGVDGGSTYAENFSHLNKKTLLANGRQSFNKQFGQIAKIILNTGVDMAPLDIQSPIKVYVATTEVQMLSVKVLEYSIRKHASMSVEVISMHMCGINIPTPKDKKNWPRTPFSFQRFLIPQLQKFEGRAIYLDSDMQVFKDIKSLWFKSFNRVPILTVRNYDASNRQPQFSVMLLDCERLDWDVNNIVKQLDDANLTYEKLMYEMVVAESTEAAIDPSWNSLERYDEEETALLHYTDMHTQPWISIHNPLGYLWCRDLLEAIDAGFIPTALVKSHIDRGYIRPSLAYQVEHRIEDPLLLPVAVKRLDSNFKPPYESIEFVHPGFWTSNLAFGKSLLRHATRKTGISKLRSKFKVYLDRQ